MFTYVSLFSNVQQCPPCSAMSTVSTMFRNVQKCSAMFTNVHQCSPAVSGAKSHVRRKRFLVWFFSELLMLLGLLGPWTGRACYHNRHSNGTHKIATRFSLKMTSIAPELCLCSSDYAASGTGMSEIKIHADPESPYQKTLHGLGLIRKSRSYQKLIFPCSLIIEKLQNSKIFFFILPNSANSCDSRISQFPIPMRRCCWNFGTLEYINVEASQIPLDHSTLETPRISKSE
jgi:hypothetical protein